MSVTPLARVGSSAAWAAMAAFAKDDPKGFEALAEALATRPGWGSITVNLHQEGKVGGLDKRESRKV
jgi:hypothetical protein